MKNFIVKFLSENTALLKTARTLIEALVAWALLLLTQALSGTVLPVEVQVAFIAFVSALLAAIIAYIGKRVEVDNG